MISGIRPRLVAIFIGFFHIYLSIQDGENLAYHAGFIHFMNTVFPLSEAYKNVIVDMECKCAKLCLTDRGACNSYCIRRIPNGFFHCRLTNMKSKDLRTETNADGNTAVRFPYHAKVSHGIIYVFINGDMTYEGAATACAQVGDFQIAVTKDTEEFEILNKIANLWNSEIWVNMTSPLNEASAFWGDGTPYADSEISSVASISRNDLQTDTNFRFKYGSFIDRVATDTFSVLCKSHEQNISVSSIEQH